MKLKRVNTGQMKTISPWPERVQCISPRAVITNKREIIMKKFIKEVRYEFLEILGLLSVFEIITNYELMDSVKRFDGISLGVAYEN